MKDRIAHIIRAKNLTAANNPSLDFVRKLKDTFPEYNLDWIVMGKGPMTVSEPYIMPVSATGLPEMKAEENKANVLDGTLFASPEMSNKSEKQQYPLFYYLRFQQV